MKEKKSGEDRFFNEPLESIESIVNTDYWEDDEPAMKNARKSIFGAVLIKILSIFLVAYIIWGYRLDIAYYFQDKGIKDFGKVTISTLKNINMKEFKKYDNHVVSISGWVELENSFAMKLNFKKYKILKLWRRPVFVVLPKENNSFIAQQETSSDIPYLEPVKGRLMTYNSMKEGFLLNSYEGIIGAYKKSQRQSLMLAIRSSKGKLTTDDLKDIKKIVNENTKKFKENGVIIVVDYFPGQDIWSLIIPLILLLYIVYSLFSIFKVFKVMKISENTQG